ncbi:hypothetical protein MUK51_10985 [Sphingobacterium faecium]|uniref:hypothetical protein n=1 Tax=Sphingobacterium faecium TaxID=34087 RepID=UPI0021B5F30B|nr:hypothetical protein [Sphingobacterium faecium]UXD67752.1 hypothetical protein MUK51_10985 [Sphingobacterium faecium]
MATKVFKTAVQAMDNIKEVIEMADVITNTSLTGELRIMNRRLNSDKEDIVINTIVVSAEQITEGYFNVNTHVPNLKNQVASNPTATDTTQPNIQRMQEIGSILMEVVDDYRGFDFILQLDGGGEIVPDGKNWFYGFTVKYTYLRRDKN